MSLVYGGVKSLGATLSGFAKWPESYIKIEPPIPNPEIMIPVTTPSQPIKNLQA